ncbi:MULTISPECIES: T9SS type A sorting domain-containing protein [Niastella]|uniref:T9SS type A sorting domain-containing protein n=1 Tax=Niastella soli TaxID=2821487 RepID=A0ABS3YPX0_9BACT|nr:T9SS type A sorting domain-containing protein [Niastella soli]MBO9199949.1 T9SS type A sorting domain-containing protein [Niastella soli]
MKQVYTLAFLLILSVQHTIAQSVTLDWGPSFRSGNGWKDGNETGTANNIGSSGVNATVTITNSQTNADPYDGFTVFTSPGINHNYYSALNSTAKSLGFGVDWNRNTRTADITIKFSAPVANVKFNIADIDKSGTNSATYIDQVTITGSKNNTAVTNPTLSKLVTTSTIFTIAGNTATANPTNGVGGSSNSSLTDQSGTVVVNFGTTQLDQVTIHYQNNSNADNDPTQQFILIGGVAFQPASTLPLTLTSFNGIFKNNAVQLNWTTSLEDNVDKFVVEKSSNSTDWQPLTIVKATGTSIISNEYKTTDATAAAVNYYRLKMVDLDGQYTYSQIIQIRSNGDEKTSVRLYPNPVANSATLNITSDNKLTATIKLYNQAGAPLQQLQRPLITGSNNIPVPGIALLQPGVYIITVEDETGKKLGTTQFFKQ